MKNIYKKTLGLLLVATTISSPATAFAGAGTMGFSGGISEGLRMPTITQRQLNPGLNGRRNVAGTFNYSEIIFVSGIPTQVNGEITVSQSATVTDDEMGTFTFTSSVSTPAAPPAEEGEEATGGSLNRDITWNVEWRRVGNQVIKNYSVDGWVENIIILDDTFTLDPDDSFFYISIIEDHNPGIVFYAGNISKRASFNDGAVVLEATGHIYGFDSPFSSTETQRLDVWVDAGDWQMSYQIRPSVSVTTSLMYQQTTPTAISFQGNYMHFMSNQSIVAYDIFIVPQQFHWIPTAGSAHIDTHTTFEQLPAADLTWLRGHFAEQDISRLFAQGILSGPTNHFVPNQVMTRGEFIQALVRALRIEVPEIQSAPTAFNRTQRIVFPDVINTRPDYRYVMAAYRSGLAYGRSDGNFHVDVPITREEAVATLIRGLGLENVVPNPMPVTAFTDSMQISGWAMRDVAAALELGLISGDANGNFRPRDILTKAEASAFINMFIDYMREDLVFDYSNRMVNFTW